MLTFEQLELVLEGKFEPHLTMKKIANSMEQIDRDHAQPVTNDHRRLHRRIRQHGSEHLRQTETILNAWADPLESGEVRPS
jgi:hypothetical protein